MALSPDLAQFQNRASGVYRLEFDKSQTATIPAEKLRLIVGFSKKGPFQTPVFVPDPGFFTEVYGSIDRGLERKGSYFHRTALHALQRGPILALNLLRLNSDEDSINVDTIEYQSMSTSASTENQEEKEALFSGFYNKDKFWFPSAESFLSNIGDTNKSLIQFTNIKQRPVSIIVRHARNISEFDINAKEWFGIGNVPDFMHENDYIKDYMVDVIIVEGDWTDYDKLALDPLFSKYFDENKGLIKSEMTSFLQDRNVNVLGTYTGSLIPDFIDLEGNNLFIESIVNFDTQIHGVLCAIDVERFDDEYLSGTYTGVDMVGHALENKTNTDPTFNKINFLSYDRPVRDDLVYAEFNTPEVDLAVNTSEDISFMLQGGTESQTPPVVSSGDVVVPGSGDVNYIIKVSTTEHSEYDSKLDNKIFENTPGNLGRTVGSYVLMSDGANYKWAPVTSLTEVSGILNIGLSIEEAGFEVYLNSDKMYFISSPNWLAHDSFDGEYISAKFNGLYDDYNSGLITKGDQVRDANESANWFLKPFNYEYGKILGEGFFTDNNSSVGNASPVMGNSYAIPSVIVESYEEADFSTKTSLPAPGSGAYLDSNEDAVDDFNVISLTGRLNSVIEIDSVAGNNLNSNEVYVDKQKYENIINNTDYLVSTETGPNGESRLTRISSIKSEGSLLKITTGTPIKKTTVNENTTDEVVYVERYREIESVIDHYKLFQLSGFKLDANFHVPNGTQDRVDAIYEDALNVSSNLFNALIDKDNITYRYIIDSFGLGIQPESKHQLSYLAKQRQNALAINNVPSMDDFKKSTNPRFTDITGALSTRFISEGGDLSQNPDFVYSLPSIDNGANYSSYFTPFLIVRDRNKDIKCPPAGLVSNNYINKYTNALPWTIVAGPRDGTLSGNGLRNVEISFGPDDRDNLEPVGLNPIVFQRGTGIMISSNKTAQQKPKSALSSIHVREVLIYIQDGIAEILKAYQMQFNTPQVRLEIKTLADNFLSGIQDDDGIYDFQNIMDQSNNNNDVLNNNLGVIDTFVEPVKGLETLIHRTTVLKTGAIATGSFR